MMSYITSVALRYWSLHTVPILACPLRPVTFCFVRCVLSCFLHVSSIPCYEVLCSALLRYVLSRWVSSTAWYMLSRYVISFCNFFCFVIYRWILCSVALRECYVCSVAFRLLLVCCEFRFVAMKVSYICNLALYQLLYRLLCHCWHFSVRPERWSVVA